MHNIDLGTVLKRTVSEGYDDLVTRHTGRAVRGGVEAQLADLDLGQVAVIDFTAVGCLDISCADEIVGKLLLDHGTARAIVLRGLTPAHGDAISAVLERHDIPAVTQTGDGRFELLGPIAPAVRAVFATVWEYRGVAVPEIAQRLSASADIVQHALAELEERRLVYRNADFYHAPVAG